MSLMLSVGWRRGKRIVGDTVGSDTIEVTARGAAAHWQDFIVRFRFPVHFSERVFDGSNPVLVDTVSRLEPERRHRCVVYVDQGLLEVFPEVIAAIEAYASHYGDRMELAAPPIPIIGGEKIKSGLGLVEQIQQVLHDHHIDRHSYVIAVGGGAVLDAVGFAAATTHRGVRHIRIATTVLSQNDSSVGVKNGVNLFGSRNFVGTFAPPFAVINDYDFITYLPARDKIAGMAEAIKVALIRDPEFFVWLEHQADDLAVFERRAMTHMIRRCAELHMRQIAHGSDPFETGSARPLDYGHWSAHKLESITRHHLRHGEAVAIGIALDARYSVMCGLLEAGQEERICCLLEHLGFRLWHSALEQREADGAHTVMSGLAEFREHLGGELTITLLESCGVGVEVHEIDADLMLESIAWLMARKTR
jgi:3-dehydroquinate synthase